MTMSTPPNCRIAARSASAMLSRELRSSATAMPISPDDFVRALPRVSSAIATFVAAQTIFAASAGDYQRDLAAELSLGRHPLQLRFLERPVLDAERFGARQRDVVVEAAELRRLLRPPRLRQRTGCSRGPFQRVGSGHHVDRV